MALLYLFMIMFLSLTSGSSASIRAIASMLMDIFARSMYATNVIRNAIIPTKNRTGMQPKMNLEKNAFDKSHSINGIPEEK